MFKTKELELEAWKTLTNNMGKHIKKCEQEINFFVEKIGDYINLFNEDMLSIEDMQEDIQPFLDRITEEKRIDDIIDKNPNQVHLIIDGKLFSSEN